MHSCPRCGQSCDCNGDWDDIEVMSPEWVAKNCNCECDYNLQNDDDFDDDYFDCCNECDLPDACRDFGCAVEQGVRVNPPLY